MNVGARWKRAHWVIALFSFNVAWIVVWYERIRPRPLWHFYHGIADNYWHTISSEPSTVFEQLVWSVALAIPLWALIVCCSRLRMPGTAFRGFILAVSVAGFPLLAVRFPFHFFRPMRIELYTPWLLLEVAIAIACVTIFSMGKWTLRVFPTIMLLAVHFILWTWITGTWANPLWEVHAVGMKWPGILISMAFYFGCPLLGFLSAIAGAMPTDSTTNG